MGNSYTTQDLLNNIQLTGHVPLAQLTFSPEQVITLADRELKTPIINQILSTRGGYYLTNIVYPQNSTGIYDIPGDAIDAALYNVELIQNVTVLQVSPLELSEQFSTNAPTTTSYGYYLFGNQLQILPSPSVGDTRLWYYKRPSTLVLTTDCALISAVSADGTQLTVTSIPGDMGIGDLVDIVGDQPPFNILGTQTITNIVGNVITLDAAPINPKIDVYASLDIQSLLYTAVTPGSFGNTITVEYQDTVLAGNEVATVAGTSIFVQIQSGVSTAQQVLTAIQASPSVLALVTVILSGAPTTVQVTMGPTSLASTPNSTVVRGNYVCLYQQTCIPQIPVEYRILLEQRTICSIYEIQGIAAKLGPAKAKLDELEKATLKLTTNRVKSHVNIIMPVNGGFLAGKWSRLANWATGREGP